MWDKNFVKFEGIVHLNVVSKCYAKWMQCDKLFSYAYFTFVIKCC